jgi:hypothetical protein
MHTLACYVDLETGIASILMSKTRRKPIMYYAAVFASEGGAVQNTNAFM